MNMSLFTAMLLFLRIVLMCLLSTLKRFQISDFVISLKEVLSLLLGWVKAKKNIERSSQYFEMYW